MSDGSWVLQWKIRLSDDTGRQGNGSSNWLEVESFVGHQTQNHCSGVDTTTEFQPTPWLKIEFKTDTVTDTVFILATTSLNFTWLHCFHVQVLRKRLIYQYVFDCTYTSMYFIIYMCLIVWCHVCNYVQVFNCWHVFNGHWLHLSFVQLSPTGCRLQVPAAAQTGQL